MLGAPAAPAPALPALLAVLPPLGPAGASTVSAEQAASRPQPERTRHAEREVLRLMGTDKWRHAHLTFDRQFLAITRKFGSRASRWRFLRAGMAEEAAVKRFLRLLGLVLLLPALSCRKQTESSGPAPDKVIKLAFVSNNPSDFWKIAAAGIHTYEKEGKVQVDLKMPPNGTPEDQNQILQNLSAQGYDAITVSVAAPNDQVPVLDAVARTSKLLTTDSDAPKSKRLLYIGTNNYEGGKTLGAEIVKLLPKGGKIAVFVGTLAADNAAQRLKGVEDATKPHGIEIVARREDNTDRAKARSNVEDMINAHPDLGLCVGLWSYNGPAIAAAIEALGKQGQVQAAVFDEETGTLLGIERGSIQVTVVQKPFEFGYLSSKWMHELATQGDAAKARLPKDGLLDTGVEVITKANVAEFKQRLEALKSGK
jgi:ribose transport system substrate-binding protein